MTPIYIFLNFIRIVFNNEETMTVRQTIHCTYIFKHVLYTRFSMLQFGTIQEAPMEFGSWTARFR